MKEDEKLVKHLYACFNQRDVEGVIALCAPDVAWANAMERTHIHGPDALKDYWKRQWAMINPKVEPKNIAKQPDGSVVVQVQQIVHDLEGKLLLDETVKHVFHIENGRVKRFDVEGENNLSTVHD